MVEHPDFFKPADMVDTTAVSAAKGGMNAGKAASSTTLDTYGYIICDDVQGVENAEVDADFAQNCD